MATNTTCLVRVESGYAYKYEGKRNWRAASSEKWEIVCADGGVVTCVGERELDGARVTVWRSAGGYYAALSQNVERLDRPQYAGEVQS